MKISLEHIAKIEGHMGFVSHIVEGEVKKAKLEVKEGARLIEGIIVGRKYNQAPLITSRICGICPIVHNLCSLKALEDAFSIEISPETKKLRKLLLSAQLLQSHTLHLFFLTLPDYFEIENDIKFIDKYPDKAKKALTVKEFSDQLGKAIGERSTHPTSTKIGGFGSVPESQELSDLFNKSKKALDASKELVEIFAGLNYPEFERYCEAISLSYPDEYALYEGKVNTSDSEPIDLEKFLPKIEEIEDPYDVVKRSKYKGKSYMVGAYARLRNNAENLNPEALKLYEGHLEDKPDTNIFYNILAQSIEVVHFIEESKKILEEVTNRNLNQEDLAPQNLQPKNTRGIACCEAPRGLLIHSYRIREDGTIKNCNIITPTAQFLENLELDLRKFLANFPEISKDKKKKKIRMLIRAYDPCISCATH